MRPKTTLKTISVLAVAIVLALLTVQGTLALWNTAVVSKEQTVESADFVVKVKSASGTSEKLASSGQAVTVPGASGLVPGESRTTEIALTNATNAGSGTFRIRVSAGAPEVSGDLAKYLKASIGVPQGADCTTFVAGKSIELNQSGTGRLCLTTELDKHAPENLGGKSASVTVALSAVQLP